MNATKKQWAITDIERIAEPDAWYMADGDCAKIKGHNVYFVDIEGAFGYSALVFCNGHHIHYANDYQLHHPGKSREELHEWYVETLNMKLFTEHELSEPLKDYDEYTRKRYFLQNYYGMREHYISCFHIKGSEQEEAERDKQIAGMVFNRVCFCYHNDHDFVKRCCQLYDALEDAKKETEESYEYHKNAFLHEMYNHEYGINWQADYDTLSAFGFVQYHGDSENELKLYFDELEFSDIKRRAYLDARKEYFEQAAEKGYI